MTQEEAMLVLRCLIDNYGGEVCNEALNIICKAKVDSTSANIPVTEIADSIKQDLDLLNLPPCLPMDRVYRNLRQLRAL